MKKVINLSKFSDADLRLIREGAAKLKMTVDQYIEVLLKASIYHAVENDLAKSVKPAA